MSERRLTVCRKWRADGFDPFLVGFHLVTDTYLQTFSRQSAVLHVFSGSRPVDLIERVKQTSGTQLQRFERRMLPRWNRGAAAPVRLNVSPYAWAGPSCQDSAGRCGLYRRPAASLGPRPAEGPRNPRWPHPSRRRPSGSSGLTERERTGTHQALIFFIQSWFSFALRPKHPAVERNWVYLLSKWL